MNAHINTSKLFDRQRLTSRAGPPWFHRIWREMMSRAACSPVVTPTRTPPSLCLTSPQRFEMRSSSRLFSTNDHRPLTLSRNTGSCRAFNASVLANKGMKREQQVPSSMVSSITRYTRTRVQSMSASDMMWGQKGCIFLDLWWERKQSAAYSSTAVDVDVGTFVIVLDSHLLITAFSTDPLSLGKESIS